MNRSIKFGSLVMVTFLVGSAVYAAVQSWRPVMPAFIVKVRTTDSADKPPTLMLIYGENGNDPFQEGSLGVGRRISHCQTVKSLCVSPAARKEFGTIEDRRQSLQVRLSNNGNGNPVVGGVSWTGSMHPAQVHVTCDLRITDVQRACTISKVIT